jgi:hypothetical protein
LDIGLFEKKKNSSHLAAAAAATNMLIYPTYIDLIVMKNTAAVLLLKLLH